MNLGNKKYLMLDSKPVTNFQEEAFLVTVIDNDLENGPFFF